MRENLRGGGRDAVGHISPAAKMVVAIRELNRTAPSNAGVDVGARAKSSSIISICRVITAQWMG